MTTTAAAPVPSDADLAADAGVVVDGPRVDEDWLALHVFYSSNANPLLEELVAPLVAELRAAGLIDRYFFLRYWMEGPHIRIRLHPASPEHADAVRRTATSRTDAYLARRPALYRLDPTVLGPLYKDMFLMEYTEEEWAEQYGADGQMPMQSTNTWAVRPYEPEYAKYGGLHGVRIAERHFERSSDLVLDLTRSTNLHVRTVMFGLAVQLMTVTCTAFLRDRDAVADFLDLYQRIWEGTFLKEDSATRDGFEANYQEMAPALAGRLGRITDAVLADEPLTGFLGDWQRHCDDLRGEVADAATAGRLAFATGPDGTGRTVTRDVDHCLRSLLVPFVHMTNNRIGVSIVDEVYLAHLVQRTLSDGRP